MLTDGVYYRESASTGPVNLKVVSNKCWVVQWLGGWGYDDCVPGEVTETVPSGDRTTWSPTWSANLPQIQLIPLEGWSVISPGGAIFVPSPKTGKKKRHPGPPQSLNDSAALAGHHGPVYMRLSFPHPLLLGILGSRDGFGSPVPC